MRRLGMPNTPLEQNTRPLRPSREKLWPHGHQLVTAQLLAQVAGDLLTVEAAVLDEDLISARSGHNYSGDINPRRIAFERNRITHRPALF